MPSKAPRGPLRLRQRRTRGAMICLCLCLWMCPAAPVQAQNWTSETLEQAEYAEPTDRYPHAVLGDALEYGALRLRYTAGVAITFRLPQDRVFEDIAPRLIDVDGDRKPEVVVVESHRDQGARLAIYNGDGLMAATPYIGTRFRWLAPIGAADLDADGHVELAYIDRPHLAKRLRVWRFKDGKLTHLADKNGLTNHRIGEDYISSGIRNCSEIPELVVVNANWSAIIAVSFTHDTLKTRKIARFRGFDSVLSALECP